MTDTTGDLSRYEPPAGETHYPTDCVIGIVPVEQAQALIDAVRAAGAGDDAITVQPADRRDDLAAELRAGGVKGFINRLTASTGGDLDVATALQRDLLPGRVALATNVGDDEALRYRVGDAYRQHQAIHVNYMGRRAIESLDGEMLG